MRDDGLLEEARLTGAIILRLNHLVDVVMEIRVVTGLLKNHRILADHGLAEFAVLREGRQIFGLTWTTLMDVLLILS